MDSGMPKNRGEPGTPRGCVIWANEPGTPRECPNWGKRGGEHGTPGDAKNGLREEVSLVPQEDGCLN